jgi:hypothetical protein
VNVECTQSPEIDRGSATTVQSASLLTVDLASKDGEVRVSHREIESIADRRVIYLLETSSLPISARMSADRADIGAASPVHDDGPRIDKARPD